MKMKWKKLETEFQDLSQENSSETDENEMKEVKNAETSIRPKRKLRDRSLIKQPENLDYECLMLGALIFLKLSIKTVNYQICSQCSSER